MNAEDWITVAAHRPVFKRLNTEAGSPFNFQCIDLAKVSDDGQLMIPRGVFLTKEEAVQFAVWILKTFDGPHTEARATKGKESDETSEGK